MFFIVKLFPAHTDRKAAFQPFPFFGRCGRWNGYGRGGAQKKTENNIVLLGMKRVLMFSGE